MSWRSSGGSRPSAPPPGASQPKGGPPVLDPTLQGLMIAAAVVGLVGLGLMAALGGTLGQSSTSTAVQPTAVAERPTAPPVATTAPTEAPAAAATTAPTAAAAATTAPTAAAAATTAPTAASGGGSTASSGTGDPAAGQVLFTTSIGGQIACNICHNIAPNTATLVGPSLAGLEARASSTVPGLSTEEYIHESIVNPSSHLVAGFTDGLMPQTFGTLLTPEQVDDLVAYLLSLE